MGWWHVCFTLYERVRAGVQPELMNGLSYIPLMVSYCLSIPIMISYCLSYIYPL